MNHSNPPEGEENISTTNVEQAESSGEASQRLTHPQMFSQYINEEAYSERR